MPAMFEILKLIDGLLKDSLSPSEIQKKRREKTLRAIGIELYVLYASVNRIIIRGEDIVSCLEHVIAQYDELVADTPECEVIGTPISYINSKENRLRYFKGAVQRLSSTLRLQADELWRLRDSIKRLAWSLEVISPEALRQLSLLVFAKGDIIDELAFMVGHQADEEATLPQTTEAHLRSAMAEIERTSLHDFRAMARREQLMHEVSVLAIKLSASPDGSQIERLRTYLRDQKPRDQLSTIETVARSLREAILANFTVHDILLGLKDERWTQ